MEDYHTLRLNTAAAVEKKKNTDEKKTQNS